MVKKKEKKKSWKTQLYAARRILATHYLYQPCSGLLLPVNLPTILDQSSLLPQPISRGIELSQWVQEGVSQDDIQSII